MANGHDTLTITLPFHDGVIRAKYFSKGLRTLLYYVDPKLTQPELSRMMHSAIQLRDIREYDGDEFDREPVFSE